MAQATALYDKDDRPAFTIFQEQRDRDAAVGRFRRTCCARSSRSRISASTITAASMSIRVFAAVLNNLRVHRAAQGGSTLTQQLARQSFLTSDKTLRRKLKEAVLAWRLEREFTKDQILELYLNKVYFGDGLYGVEAASLGFFGKHARDLDVEEAALLAGLVKSPSTYAPTINLDRALARRNVVLRRCSTATRSIARRTSSASAQPAAPRRCPALRRGGYGQHSRKKSASSSCSASAGTASIRAA